MAGTRCSFSTQVFLHQTPSFSPRFRVTGLRESKSKKNLDLDFLTKLLAKEDRYLRERIREYTSIEKRIACIILYGANVTNSNIDLQQVVLLNILINIQTKILKNELREGRSVNLGQKIIVSWYPKPVIKI